MKRVSKRPEPSLSRLLDDDVDTLVYLKVSQVSYVYTHDE